MFTLLHETFGLPGKRRRVTPHKTGQNDPSTGSKEFSFEKTNRSINLRGLGKVEVMEPLLNKG